MGLRVNFSEEAQVPETPQEGRSWVFKSKSRPDLEHYVTLINGKINCTCEGWRGHRKCWHTTSVLKEIEEGA